MLQNILAKRESSVYNSVNASVAQLVEQRIRNAWVRGSSPLGSFCCAFAQQIKSEMKK